MTFPTTAALVRYTKISEIGQQGQNSKVYKALDHQTQKEIAIKEVKKSKFKNLADFFTEAQTLSSARHPNVVPILYACNDVRGKNICLAMPLYWGSVESLMDIRPLTTGEVVRIGLEFLAGLQAIHAAGLIHFDVKPDNIMIGDGGKAMVADFGLAQQTNAFGVASPAGFYPKGVPPEAYQPIAHTLLFDIYGAGVTLYRMCVGGASFQAQYARARANDLRAMIEAGKFPSRNAYPPHVPMALRKVINKAMNPSPVSRFKSAVALSNALGQVRHLRDWQFDGAGKWTRIASDRILTVTATLNQQTKDCQIHASQSFTASGRTARILPECRVVTRSSADSEIRGTLMRLD